MELVPEIAALITSGLVPGRTAPICFWATLRKMVFANVNAMTMPPICARLMKAIASEVRCQKWIRFINDDGGGGNALPDDISERGTTA